MTMMVPCRADVPHLLHAGLHQDSSSPMSLPHQHFLHEGGNIHLPVNPGISQDLGSMPCRHWPPLPSLFSLMESGTNLPGDSLDRNLCPSVSLRVISWGPGDQDSSSITPITKLAVVFVVGVNLGHNVPVCLQPQDEFYRRPQGLLGPLGG